LRPSHVRAPSSPPPPPLCAVLIDSLSRRAGLGVCAAYTVALVVCIIGGALGPDVLTRQSVMTLSESCPLSASECVLEYRAAAGALSPLNMVAAVGIALQRPAKQTGEPAALQRAVTYTQQYQLDVFLTRNGETQQTVRNVSNNFEVSCAAGAAVCASTTLFTLWQVDFTDVKYNLRLLSPLTEWASLDPGVMSNGATLALTASVSVVNAQYTTFHLGWRYFFVTASIAVFIAYSVALRCAPGAKDRTGRRLVTGLEQRWVWALSLLLVGFNDPFYAASILIPNVGAAAWSGITTVTFIVILLLYWAIHLHVSTLQVEASQRWQLDPVAMSKLGFLFWAPKIVFSVLFWAVALAVYLWTRHRNLSDPTYSAWQLVSSFAAFVWVTLGILAAAYLLYMFALAVLACRHVASMRGSNRMFLILTAVTFVLVICGVWVGVFTPARITTDAFLVVYGGANLYVWCLAFLFLPNDAVTIADRVDEVAADDAGRDVDTTGVMAASGLADFDVDMRDVAGIADAHGQGAGAGTGAGTASRGGGRGKVPAAPASSFVIDEDEDGGEGDLGMGAMGTMSGAAAAATTPSNGGVVGASVGPDAVSVRVDSRPAPPPPRAPSPPLVEEVAAAAPTPSVGDDA